MVETYLVCYGHPISNRRNGNNCYAYLNIFMRFAHYKLHYYYLLLLIYLLKVNGFMLGGVGGGELPEVMPQK